MDTYFSRVPLSLREDGRGDPTEARVPARKVKMPRFGQVFCAVVGLAGAAAAAETAQSLRQAAIEHCQAVVASNPPPSGASAACTCVVDRIIADFGPEAAKMLKVLIADIRPADVVLAAALLQVSETEAQRFLEAAQAKMGPIEKACVHRAQAAP